MDIGTGDGRFAYESAGRNPTRFYIGIDANARPLQKISMKATRKPAKGGLPNLLFVNAALEQLPRELEATADEIHIHFPWGSLLRAVALGDENALRAIHRISASGCLIEIVIGTHSERDRSDLQRLGPSGFVSRLC